MTLFTSEGCLWIGKPDRGDVREEAWLTLDYPRPQEGRGDVREGAGLTLDYTRPQEGGVCEWAEKTPMVHISLQLQVD